MAQTKLKLMKELVNRSDDFLVEEMTDNYRYVAVLVHNQRQDKAFMGVAEKGHKDEFDYNLGYEIAFSRAVQALMRYNGFKMQRKNAKIVR